MATDSQSSTDSESAIRQRHRRAADELIPSETAKLYIGGEWVKSSSGKTFHTHDPTTGEALAEIQAGSAEDIDRAVDAAWDAYDNRWAAASAADRQRVLNQIADRIESRKGDFATLESLDNGKPVSEARIDVSLVIDHFRYFAGATRVNEGKTIPGGTDNHIQTLREPYGVVGQIIPWNFPLLMAAWKLGPALAAGNTVVLKPAEETPLSILELMREIDAVLPAGVVNVVTGFGAEAGEPLSRHEGIQKLAFTGSTEVGRGVMKSAADTITDVTLELGGKSPVVIYPDADVEKAANVARIGMFHNTGECCCAGTRLLVHEDIKSEFLDAFVAEIEELQVGDPLLEETTLGPKVTKEQANRTLDYINEAKNVGAEVVTGGDAPDDEALSEGCFVNPTLLTDIDHESRPVQEEIFGPVETLFEWSSYDDMIELANDVDYGLAAGIITNDINQAYKTAKDIEAGNIWVNTYNEFPAGQPFGGYKQSGIGRETAYEAIKHYTQTKTINISLD